MGRAETRLRLVWGTALRAPLRRARRPEAPRTILIAHNLLLGDTLMLAALFAALRARYPEARIVTTCPPAIVPLFAGRPWGVEAVAYNPRQPETLKGVRAALRGATVDLALLPGDNRHALLARACGARWIVGFAGDRPDWKNRLCDALLPWPDAPEVLSDLFVRLAGSDAPTYRPGQWPGPATAKVLALPRAPYAVLHVGAGNPLRYWLPERWAALARLLADRGITPVWSAGPGEEELIRAIDPAALYPAFAGSLDLPALWHLLAGAALLVCPDSGVAHLAKLTATPTLCLFGQGNDRLFGAGRFFSGMPFVALIEREMPCRDQNILFGRALPWVQRCARRPDTCKEAVCMRALEVDAALAACERLLAMAPQVS